MNGLELDNNNSSFFRSASEFIPSVEEEKIFQLQEVKEKVSSFCSTIDFLDKENYKQRQIINAFKKENENLKNLLSIHGISIKDL